MKVTRKLLIALLLAALILPIAASAEEEWAEFPVTEEAPDGEFAPTEGVKLNVSRVKLNPGDSTRLKATVSPEDADPSVIWSSTAPDVADVDEEGLVTATGYGSAIVFCTTADGGFRARCAVTVATPLNAGESLRKTMDCGQTMVYIPASGMTAKSWSSSNAKVATVEDGIVTAKEAGNAVITLEFVGAKAATVVVLVHDSKKPEGLSLDPSGEIRLNLGDPLRITPVLTPETAEAVYTWTSSNEGVATVEDGVVTAHAEGKTTIAVRAKYGSKSFKDSVTVNVVDPFRPESVELNATETKTITTDEVLRLVAFLSPETAQADFAWESSEEDVATVADGMVTPLKEGTAKITVKATHGDAVLTSSVKVEVIDPHKIAELALKESGTQELRLGSAITLTPVLTPASAQAEYTWESSDEDVATVRNGKVTPVAEGTAKITLTATHGDDEKSASVKVKVIDPNKLEDFALEPSETQTMGMGFTLELHPVVTPAHAPVEYTWESSDEEVATVEDGVVTALSEGKTTITVTAKQGEIVKTDSVKIRVIDAFEPTAVALNYTERQKIAIGETLELIATLTPDTATGELVWTSSDPEVAAVENGIVTGVAKGSAEITVKAVYGEVEKKATVRVKVVKP